MRLLGYVRVSTDDQARNGVSLGDQEDKIRAYAALTDGELVEIVRDEGRSGKDLDRPGVQDALSRVLSGEADALVVYAIDRLSRSVLDLLALVARLQDAGRGFVSVREQMDSSTPHGRFTMTILAAVAEMEREMIRARCRDASARCFKERRVYGIIPFGFRRDGKRLVEDAAEMEVLLGIVALREEGIPFYRIAERLNETGKRSKKGGKWHASSVRSVLLTYEKLTPKVA